MESSSGRSKLLSEFLNGRKLDFVGVPTYKYHDFLLNYIKNRKYAVDGDIIYKM